MSRRIAPYGSWTSPVTAELIVADTVGFNGVWLDGGDVYWSEQRPSEGGRNVVVRRTADGAIEDVLPPPYSARSRVNEYGGGAVAIADGIVYFTNNADQRVYALAPGHAPRALTPADGRRYADLVVDRARRRILAVCEDHRPAGEPVQSLVAIPIEGGREPRTLAAGRDFYAAPRLSPDGRRLAFLAWDHPNMPWDGCTLHVAALDEAGNVASEQQVAGGARESVFAPAFSPEGVLHFVSDRSGWWNLYREDRGEPLAPMAAEFGAPQWVLGLSTYAFAGPHIVCAFNERGTWRLGLFDRVHGTWRALALPYSDIGYVQADDARAVFVAAGPETLPELAALDVATGRCTVIRRSARVAVDTDSLSPAVPFEFATSGGERAHAFFYPPRNADFRGPPGTRPPLLVLCHGGPTSATTSALNLKIQYWTSRGFAVLDVNYRGSTGYGRAYRKRLEGAWGVVDVEDCIAGAQQLAKSGEVDAIRLAIRGSSAGGFTTLCALAFHNVFRAGAVYYGVSDLEALARDTHKFESRYLERLVGPYPAGRARYRARSPLHHAERLRCPVIFFQGLEDRVVPPDQTERLVAALRARGVPVAYIAFPGEQHGFRIAANVKHALLSELRFYGRVFGFATDVDALVPDPLA